MQNYKLVLEYDGTDYNGWQKQPDLPTVQGALEEALARLAEVSSPLYAAGRTDAGVHAKGQVVSFHAELKAPPERLPAALNSFLPSDIVVKGCEKVDEAFNARKSALAREYIYYIYTGRYPSPFNRRFTYHYHAELEEDRMREALGQITGVHDFAAFCRREERKSSVREVHEVKLTRSDDVIAVRVRANAFVWMMMRMLCGSLLEVGRGKWSPQRFAEVLDSGDNSLSGPALPPLGLFLEKVYY
jgi:tRNA pseudouridine38-40 synthase